MNNLPNVFANKIKNKIDNSQEFTRVNDQEITKLSKNEIEKKINDIFASNKYIYKIKVIITLNSTTKEYTLVGKTTKDLITIDNTLIPINSIEDISLK